MSLDDIVIQCPNCGKSNDEFEIKTFFDFTYLTSQCGKCDYVNWKKTERILQIQAFLQ